MREPALFHLEPAAFGRVRPLLAGLDEHLAAQAILARDVPGQVVVDDPQQPAAALAWTGHRFHLAGDPNREGFNAALRRLFTAEIYPQAQVAGQTEFTLYPAPGDRQAQVGVILGDKYPIQDHRECYEWDAASAGEAHREDGRDHLPAGFVVRAVDARLLADAGLAHVDDLIEEVQSEGGSVADFLDKRFGVCVLHEAEIVGWCVSEFNSGDRCEVGIATDTRYRRRGLATAMTATLIAHAQARGISRIGWHCWASNRPSAATALRAGFTRRQDYPVYFAWFDPIANLAVNGNVRLHRGQYTEAAAWFHRALTADTPPRWAYFPAACAAAMADQPDAALSYLQKAIASGVDIARVRTAEQLRSLHDTEMWRILIDVV